MLCIRFVGLRNIFHESLTLIETAASIVPPTIDSSQERKNYMSSCLSQTHKSSYTSQDKNGRISHGLILLFSALLENEIEILSPSGQQNLHIFPTYIMNGTVKNLTREMPHGFWV